MPRAKRLEGSFIHRLPMGTDAAAVRQRIEAMEHLLERSLTIPGLNRKVGLDVLLDFVPGVGPSVAAAMGAYLAFEARNLGMPKRTIARMAGNIGVDWALGMIPFVGAIPDYFFRSNTRNVRLIKRYLDKHHPASRVIDQ
ncbi:DUF4112 domain-containing protein [Sphingomonas sp. HT-1]|uniref:DUF4112 domain-containing protein n=1 Tax=unclassified Sphingomonas TaxID=196159 RepID=UPI0002D9E180|nr:MULTISPECIES: DUF4112 domain-containing protein [unclassified Sphingomonas]KTF68844.1 hypothetical protein ATB93_11785 [Sphingomonas sp. WG]